MERSESGFVWIGAIVLLFILLSTLLLPDFLKSTYSSPLAEEKFAGVEAKIPEVVHLSTPEPLKALYMTACVAGTPSWRESLKKLIEDTELNAVVIDIKDYTGTVSFPNNFERVPNQKGCVVSDMKEFIKSLHEANIYVIGRISVFQDLTYSNLHPELAVKSLSTGGVWKDRKGISFIDVGAKPYWDYIIDISKQAHEIGFDELNFDYIRYPSDGNMQDANYTWLIASSTRAEMLESFFSYLHNTLKNFESEDGATPVISADLFGMTTTVTVDMGIGQVLERALPYFDYVAPMVYPSHYPPGWNGFKNPADNPYEVIKIAMSEGKRREEVLNVSRGLATSTPSKLRPWIQDFDLGATYDADKVQAQIKATYDAGLSSWMLWDAANKYTPTALLPDEAKNLQAER